MHDVCGMDATAANPAPLLYFEAVLKPHRSLSRGALLGVLGGMAVVSLYVTTLMYLLGAWPVIGFNGADLALAALLFWLNARAARAREIIRLRGEEIEITTITPAGRARMVSVPPGWARAELQERPGAVPRLVIRTPNAIQEIGRSLGAAQKQDLAAALNRALARWRGPPS